MEFISISRVSHLFQAFMSFLTLQIPSSNFKSQQNQAVLKRLINEVKVANPSFIEKDIRGIWSIKLNGYLTLRSYYLEAAYRFFRTRKKAESVSRRGLSDRKRVYKRRYERLLRVRINESQLLRTYHMRLYLIHIEMKKERVYLVQNSLKMLKKNGKK